MTTPEGKVKKDITRVLKAFGVYYFMPVQSGFGAAGVDYHCVIGVNCHVLRDKKVIFTKMPYAFFIEAKRPDKQPTDRQETFLKDRREQQGCKTFVIDGDVSLQELVKWLEIIEEHNERTRPLAEGRRPNVGVGI